MMFGGRIARTQQTVREACLAGFTMLFGITSWFSLICASLREVQQRSSGVPAGPCHSHWQMLVPQRPGCFCWVVPLLLIAVSYLDAPEPGCCCIREVFASALSCRCWFMQTGLQISWQCRLDSLQRTISKQINIFLSPINLFFPLSLVDPGLKRG